MVTVLFADLVGFTSLSQSRDPEDVRELLSRYFDTCSALVERYGGAVEKFIGDAVMAVWGAPVAQEDDAERAVRTALDLVAAVAALGAEVGEPGLSARAGVLTGEAAVTIGAKGQGMVAGDLVNTASRIQSVAEPGTVLVGDSTRRATEAAVTYADAVAQQLKGKTAPVAVHQALRIVAGVGGVMKSEGLEPPFVGRDRELKLVKDLFHSTAEARRAQLVQVTGVAGIGKSRLVWEFFKYTDGITSTYLWHRGRCLAYGDGVTYWALAEMVRARAGIHEGEDRASALDKLGAALDRYVPDPDDRRFVEPRLAQLLGLEDRAVSERQELFSAWRLFFERLAEQLPVVMVFEDMQWADAPLLEFVGHLLERSRNHPIFVLALARPETPAAALGATQRNAAFIHLEPLGASEMRELMAGFVPGLPDDLTGRILERAEGVPLYAVETVRMLLDRGLLVQDGPVYRPTGPVHALEVPETLHALIAARLDGMHPGERNAVQDAAVLGKSFTKQALRAVSGGGDAELDAVLAALVAKEVLTIQADPRFAELGQYGFVQDLMRTVAYETLSRHDRKCKHLAAASYLEQAWGSDEEEIAEVVAAHLLQAHRLEESADDAPEIRDRARAMLVRAGERAASLAACEQAQTYFDQAASLTDSVGDRAELTRRAGEMAELRAHFDASVEYYERATALFTEAGQGRERAICQASLAGVEYTRGHLDDAIVRMTAARAALDGAEPDVGRATVAAQLGRFLALANRVDQALPVLEEALELAARLQQTELYSEALNSRGICLIYRGRIDEAVTMLRRALEVALAHDLTRAAVRAYNNLIVALWSADRFNEAMELSTRALALARRAGATGWELRLRTTHALQLAELGRWDEVTAVVGELGGGSGEPEHDWPSQLRLGLVPVLLARGDVDGALACLESTPFGEEAEQEEIRVAHLYLRARVRFSQGRLDESLSTAERALESRAELGLTHPDVKRALVHAVDTALALGDADKAGSLLQIVETALPGEVSPWLRAQAARLGARLGALRGDGGDFDAAFEEAEAGLRSVDTPFELAVTLLEHAEWRDATAQPAAAEPLVAEAAAIFERLGATPWLERAEALRRLTGQLTSR